MHDDVADTDWFAIDVGIFFSYIWDPLILTAGGYTLQPQSKSMDEIFERKSKTPPFADVSKEKRAASSIHIVRWSQIKKRKTFVESIDLWFHSCRQGRRLLLLALMLLIPSRFEASYRWKDHFRQGIQQKTNATLFFYIKKIFFYDLFEETIYLIAALPNPYLKKRFTVKIRLLLASLVELKFVL